ncbi:uncharacterized protein LOC123312533 isoform X2 [Coccinella septempunctata]|uniref:uncharacterized protein LOC123312533 isoform X2 n=1 Tax=Coccinella septempunctata TaxID=41139 RepID=UPI001D07B476|nr:uncharacterized protein LOC123312533 isoform X2 [Coccinella septempunctata]
MNGRNLFKKFYGSILFHFVAISSTVIFILQVPMLQRLCYDMSPVHSSKPIFIWFLGLPGSGRTTHVHLLCEKLGLGEIPVVDLLTMESKMDTDRGKIISQALKGKISKMPDELVVDLIKEALLSNSITNPRKGFIINNFPRSRKQAKLFLKEIKDVDVIFYLFADMATLINRLQGKYSERPEDEENFKKKIVNYAKEVKEALSGMRAKNEKECVQFARERNGLAFNFSPREVSKVMVQTESYFENCQVLGCPEVGNSSTLIPDEYFDYYSAFGNMNTTVNATCISSTGIFTITQSKENNIKSINHCQKLGGDLADVLSETRTKQLANLVNLTVDSWYKASYVGLDDLINKGHFQSSNGNQIHCTRYRAWGPGHPWTNRRAGNCVALHSDKTWKVTPCDVKLTAICEFFPEGPLVDEFDEGHLCGGLSRRRKRCLTDKKLLGKLIKSSGRKDKCALLNYDEGLIQN